MTEKVETVAALRARVKEWRSKGESVALVPTMGALHEGHMGLICAAKKKAAHVVASVFVNPTQFAPGEDFEKYARQLDKDFALLEQNGCDLLFAPSVAEMYPEGFATQIDPGPLAKKGEGAFRPIHFFGVATVVSKLFLQVMPDYACFGEKDYQQLLIIKHFVRDLNFPIEIVPVPIVREEDGLARSSRNVYLSAQERQTALVLSRTLRGTAEALRAGAETQKTLGEARDAIQNAGFILDYFDLCDPETLESLPRFPGVGRLIVAAKIGSTRLIDNWAV